MLLFDKHLLSRILEVFYLLWILRSVAASRIPINLNYPYISTQVCEEFKGISKDQRSLCFNYPDTTIVALQGLKNAVKECQNQFQSHRWNCADLMRKNGNPLSSPIFQKGYREAAFAQALLAAGIALSIARECSLGTLRNCGCGSDTEDSRESPNKIKYFPHKTNFTLKDQTSMRWTLQKQSLNNVDANGLPWKWGGCSHNFQFGMLFAKMFLNRNDTSLHAMVNLQNNRIGRMAVTQNTQIKCRCHGISGSCGLKTCWKTSPDLKTIGKVLRDKYRSAKLVEQQNSGRRGARKFSIVNDNTKRNKKRKQPRRPVRKKRSLLSQNLVYYQKSPSFCDKIPEIDIAGTSGRECNKTKEGPGSCSTLCCGRGHNLVKRIRTENCNCKFNWCCDVKCEICTTEEWVSVCK